MTDLTFDWQIDEFMVYCQSKQLRPKTMQSYEQALRLFARWCCEERNIETVDLVQESDIRRYINDLQQRGKYTAYVKDSQKLINHPERRRDFSPKRQHHHHQQLFAQYQCFLCLVGKSVFT